MKKRGVLGFAVTLILFIFLLSGVFAAPDSGTCAITTRAECSGSSHIVMGLSSTTNAHGEIAPGIYPYVLCCNLGTGSTTCTGANKIVGLSSTTNAHAQSPSQTSYLNNVCYGDLQCDDFMNSCPANSLSVLSLSSTTNAHLGGINDYSTKICCASSLAAQCAITEAHWDFTDITGNTIEEKHTARLIVTGNSACDGKTVSFEVRESDPFGAYNPVATEPVNVNFNGGTAVGSWMTEWQDDGVLGGDPEYYFVASFADDATKTITSDEPKLTVKKASDTKCDAISSCSDYTSKSDCNSDSEANPASGRVCNINGQSGEGTLDCGLENNICFCKWDDSTNKCGFAFSTIDGTLECMDGQTKCKDLITGGDYCYPGTSCPTDETPLCNNDGTCDAEEGCTCADCNNKQDTCTDGAKCSGGQCVSSTTCTTSQVICGSDCCNAGENCADGKCIPQISFCDSNQIQCDSNCCNTGQSCSNGACVIPSTCTTSQVICGSDCCNAGESCSSGSCVSEETGSGATVRISSTGAGGSVAGVTITNGGSGYSVGDTVSISNSEGDGEGAILTISMTGAGGSVAGVTITNGGSGYEIGDTGILIELTLCDSSTVGCGDECCESEQICTDNGCKYSDGTPCDYGYTLCNSAGVNYCNIGDTCPSGQTLGNNNESCDMRIDGCLSADCIDGDRDTCSDGLYCMSKECSSVELPLSLELMSCKVTQTLDKDCSTAPVGYKTITWKGTWTGEQEGAAYEKCVAGGSSTVPCPAEIQLPFFDYAELIVTIIVIAGIYVSLIVRGKLRRNKK
ncbi:Uncharacterised protein [uncultured archaeon]|nr:Uncharacterised protein [uncultured archaeon]